MKNYKTNRGVAPWLVLLIVLLFITILLGYRANLQACASLPGSGAISCMFQQVIFSIGLAPGTENALPEKASGTVTASGSQYGVEVSLTFPLEGGQVNGSLGGFCSGTITGTISSSGAISGSTSGAECGIPIVGPSFADIKGSFSGTVSKHLRSFTIQGSGSGKNEKDGSIKSGGGSMVLSY